MLEFRSILNRELRNVDAFSLRQAELYIIIRLFKPKIVIETGVENGFSSTFILEALKNNGLGELYSIEILKTLTDGKKSGWLVPAHLENRWNLLIANSLKILPRLLPQLGAIDMFIHDSAHAYKTMIHEFELAWAYLDSGDLLLSDDTGRNKAFIHFCENVNRLPNWTWREYGLVKK